MKKMGSCCGKPETDFSRHKTCRRPSAEKGGSKIDLPEDDDGTISIEPRYVIYRPAVEHQSTRLKPQLQVNREPTTDISPYAEQRYKDGLEYARKATQYDQHGHFSGAVAFYNEAVEALSQACTMAPVFTSSMDQVMDYRRRAEEIRQYLSTTKANPPAPAASGQNIEKDKVSKAKPDPRIARGSGHSPILRFVTPCRNFAVQLDCRTPNYNILTSGQNNRLRYLSNFWLLKDSESGHNLPS